jgi:hypothetical protein
MNVECHLILTLNTHKTPFNSFYALNLAKTRLGDFFTKTSGHPVCQLSVLLKILSFLAMLFILVGKRVDLINLSLENVTYAR